MKKITSANSTFLAAARKVFNAKTYKRLVEAVNGPGGEAEARAIAARYITVSVEELAARLSS